MNVFTLSLWENFRWGLIYFDQFISLVKITNYQSECTVTPVHIHRVYKYNKNAYLNIDIKPIAMSKNDTTKGTKICHYSIDSKYYMKHRLAPVLKTIFHQCVISYTCSQSYSDGSVLRSLKQSHQSKTDYKYMI